MKMLSALRSFTDFDEAAALAPKGARAMELIEIEFELQTHVPVISNGETSKKRQWLHKSTGRVFYQFTQQKKTGQQKRIAKGDWLG